MATKEADNGKSWKVLSRGEGGSPLLDEEVLKQPMYSTLFLPSCLQLQLVQSKESVFIFLMC